VDERRFMKKLRDLQGNAPLEAFAMKLGIDPSYLSRLYRGKRSPGARVIEGALRAFPRVSLREWGLRSPDDVPPRAKRPVR
jgi:transcriptional regulator with XRE-family HTH domain